MLLKTPYINMFPIHIIFTTVWASLFDLKPKFNPQEKVKSDEILHRLPKKDERSLAGNSGYLGGGSLLFLPISLASSLSLDPLDWSHSGRVRN